MVGHQAEFMCQRATMLSLRVTELSLQVTKLNLQKIDASASTGASVPLQRVTKLSVRRMLTFTKLVLSPRLE